MSLHALLLAATLADTGRATPPPPDSSRADTAIAVRVGAFVDGYYAWDAGRPRRLDRAYTTQPARHNEFNVNLAYVEVVLDGSRVRGRLALQAGTAVQSNSFAEPQVGSVSGGVLSRTIQEATVGVRLHPRLWVDGGIYLSHIGLESWISRDNPTYTRSLVADYTPYYLSGARLSWAATRTVRAQLHVVNGWQNVSETNAAKAVGTRVDWTPRPSLLLAWVTFAGDEQPDSLPGRLRLFNQFLARWTPAAWEVTATLDAGRQARPGGGGDTWSGGALVARRAIAPRVRLSARAEYLHDRHQVLVATGTPGGFRTTSASLGLDVAPDARLLWRTEVRGWRARDPIWPRRDDPAARRGTVLLVTSLALTL